MDTLRENDAQKKTAVAHPPVKAKNMHRTRFGYALGFFLLLVSAFATAGDRGYFGFTLSVKTSGFMLNPTLERINIVGVAPGSPAALKGVVAKDEILKMDGVAIAGRKAKELKSLAARDVGQTLNLEMKRPDGSVYRVSLVAGERPN